MLPHPSAPAGGVAGTANQSRANPVIDAPPPVPRDIAMPLAAGILDLPQGLAHGKRSRPPGAALAQLLLRGRWCAAVSLPWQQADRA